MMNNHMIARITNEGMPIQNPITAPRRTIPFENKARFYRSQQKVEFRDDASLDLPELLADTPWD
jgi:hypothetical protein